jgi:hypothetical protein
MVTNEQIIDKAVSEIERLKQAYINAVKLFNCKTNVSADDVLEVHIEAVKYFNFCENFVGKSDLLGAHKSELWINGFAENCYAILETVVLHYDFIQSKKNLFETKGSYPKPTRTSYANMQRLVVLYINKSDCNKLKNAFNLKGLPLYGFYNETKQVMNKKTQTILSFVFGVVFIIVLLFITILIPNPTQFQQNIFWVILAIAGGGAVASFPGFIEVKFGNWLRAGGALAVFAVIYLISPASNHDKKESSRTNIEQVREK